MDNTKAIVRTDIRQTALVLICSVLVPFLIHFIPFQSRPIGAVLLPMFFAPLIALVFFSFHVAVLTALLAPVLNHFITGMPVFSSVAMLTTELVLFVLVSKFFISFKFTKYFAALMGIIVAVFAVQMFFNSFTGFKTALLSEYPGFLSLLIINIIVINLKKKYCD